MTSLQAAFSGSPGRAVGKLVGSNISNILGILSVTAKIRPIPVPAQIASPDIWVMIAATALVFLTATSRWNIPRLEGGVMLAAYLAYCIWPGMNIDA